MSVSNAQSCRAIDFRLMFPYYGSVRNWLPYSIWIEPLPERGSLTNAALVVDTGLERKSVPSPKFV